MAKWSLDLTKYAKKKETEIKEVRKAYAFALYSSIVKKTPVDTGRAKGNWNISANAPDNSVDEKITKSQLPAKIQKNQAELDKVEGEEPIFISNNLPYIEKLEYGGYPNPPKKDGGKTANGFSKQAPQGMIGVTLANNENIFKAACRAVENENE